MGERGESLQGGQFQRNTYMRDEYNVGITTSQITNIAAAAAVVVETCRIVSAVPPPSLSLSLSLSLPSPLSLP